MKVLVVGGGGREHVLCWKLAQSARVSKLYCAPGNAGIAQTHGDRCGAVECVDISPENLEGLLRFARRERIDLTVVGPEAPLCAGIVDKWKREDLPVFGPEARGAELENSKAFTKSLLRKHGIPTADFQIFEDNERAKTYIEEHGEGVVVKADGLAAGKGVIVATSVEEATQAVEGMLLDGQFGDAGKKVIVEERLSGEETSVIAFTDGETIALLPSSQDHKPAFDNDEGPNTGGMGAYSPAPCLDKSLEDKVVKEILIPTLHALKKEDRPFKGMLYAGLMLTKSGPMLLEYNVRFGDPECQCLLPRVENDLVDVMECVISGDLKDCNLKIANDAAVCITMASGGYPGSYEKGKPISGLNSNGQLSGMEGVTVFHAGTVMGGKNKQEFVTAGGRVLGVTALGNSLGDAVDNAYRAVSNISWEGAHYRSDIAKKGLERA